MSSPLHEDRLKIRPFPPELPSSGGRVWKLDRSSVRGRGVGWQLRHAYRKGAVSSQGKKQQLFTLRIGRRTHDPSLEGGRQSDKKEKGGRRHREERKAQKDKQTALLTDGDKRNKDQGEHVPCHWKEGHNFHSLSFPEKRNKWKRQVSSGNSQETFCQQFWRELYFSSLGESVMCPGSLGLVAATTRRRGKGARLVHRLLFLLCVHTNIPLAKAPEFSNC